MKNVIPGKDNSTIMRGRSSSFFDRGKGVVEWLSHYQETKPLNGNNPVKNRTERVNMCVKNFNSDNDSDNDKTEAYQIGDMLLFKLKEFFLAFCFIKLLFHDHGQVLHYLSRKRDTCNTFKKFFLRNIAHQLLHEKDQFRCCLFVSA